MSKQSTVTQFPELFKTLYSKEHIIELAASRRPLFLQLTPSIPVRQMTRIQRARAAARELAERIRHAKQHLRRGYCDMCDEDWYR